MLNEPDIILDGKKVPISISDGLYKTFVRGKLYISETFKGIVEGLQCFHTISFSSKYIPSPVSEEEQLKAAVWRLKSVLAASNSLEERQNALSQLEVLSEKSSEAANAVTSIRNKPVSYGAMYIAKICGKKNFSDVTAIQISESVQSILHKKDLLNELSNIVRLDA